MRLRINERVSDLIESDIPLCWHEEDAEGASGGASRDAFNNFVTAHLPRLAERACFRGDDRQELREELVRIIRDMFEGRLVSQAFPCCLERHCGIRMGTFDSEAWRVKAMHVSWPSEEVNHATSQ